MTSLRELEHASLELEDAQDVKNADYLRNLALLVAAERALKPV